MDAAPFISLPEERRKMGGRSLFEPDFLAIDNIETLAWNFYLTSHEVEDASLGSCGACA